MLSRSVGRPGVSLDPRSADQFWAVCCEQLKAVVTAFYLFINSGPDSGFCGSDSCGGAFVAQGVSCELQVLTTSQDMSTSLMCGRRVTGTQMTRALTGASQSLEVGAAVNSLPGFDRWSACSLSFRHLLPKCPGTSSSGDCVSVGVPDYSHPVPQPHSCRTRKQVSAAAAAGSAPPPATAAAAAAATGTGTATASAAATATAEGSQPNTACKHQSTATRQQDTCTCLRAAFE